MRPKSFFSIIACALVALVSACTTVDYDALTPTNPGRFGTETAQPRFGDSDPVTEWEGGAPFSLPVHGIDVAKWQREVDWRAVKGAGIEFAFIKATEGGDRLDERFKQNWRAAGQAGIARGAYHFLYFCTPAEVQARWFIRNVPRERGALPPVLDAEWNPHSPTCTIRPPAAEVRAKMKTWLDIIERHYGQRPIIYTTVDFHRENLVGQMKGETYWLRSTATHPSVTYPGRNWMFWQYTATGRLPGTIGDTDINAFAGSQRQWREWLAKNTR